MEMPGFEPGAFRMRSERDTTTLHPRSDSLPEYVFNEWCVNVQKHGSCCLVPSYD